MVKYDKCSEDCVKVFIMIKQSLQTLLVVYSQIVTPTCMKSAQLSNGYINVASFNSVHLFLSRQILLFHFFFNAEIKKGPLIISQGKQTNMACCALWNDCERRSLFFNTLSIQYTCNIGIRVSILSSFLMSMS